MLKLSRPSSILCILGRFGPFQAYDSILDKSPDWKRGRRQRDFAYLAHIKEFDNQGRPSELRVCLKHLAECVEDGPCERRSQWRSIEYTFAGFSAPMGSHLIRKGVHLVVGNH